MSNRLAPPICFVNIKKTVDEMTQDMVIGFLALYPEPFLFHVLWFSIVPLIPYQLRKEADVEIRIYNTEG